MPRIECKCGSEEFKVRHFVSVLCAEKSYIELECTACGKKMSYTSLDGVKER